VQPDEKELLTQVFDGVPGAFEAFLHRYRGLVFAVFSAPGFNFPRDYIEDIFQSFVVALSRNDYRKLRSFEGRNAATLATFLQVVATRFALDVRRRWRRQPQGRGEAGRDDDRIMIRSLGPGTARHLTWTGGVSDPRDGSYAEP
jgi:DNA-directed RNA polymerase specialized sigma24 family protein